MILKTLLALAGIRASRPSDPPRRARNEVAHEAINREQSIFAGCQMVALRSMRLSEAVASDPTNGTRIRKGVDDMRTVMAEVARRADR